VTRTVARLSIPFREPFVTASGVVAARELALRRIEEDGVTGFGEAAPFEPYDGVALDTVVDALSNGAGGPPQARAAEEMARLDLEARRAGRPVGEPGAEAIAVNRTLPAGPPKEVAERARQGIRDGFSCFKVKVGLTDDDERVGAVREAIGPWPALRVDANGAWSVEEAIGEIDRLQRHDLQLVEQPCRTLEELAVVRRAVDVPIAADEPIATAENVRGAAGSSGRARPSPPRASTAWSPTCRAPWTGRGGSPRRCSWPPPSGSRWRAAWRRSSCSTPSWRARCPRRGTACSRSRRAPASASRSTTQRWPRCSWRKSSSRADTASGRSR
jgi:hypothetical protein